MQESDRNQAALDQAVSHWNQGNHEGYLEFYAPNVVLHGFADGLPPGRAGARLFYQPLWAAFPDARLALQDVMVVGDIFAIRFTLSGTHTGELMGMPPTGKRFSVTAGTIMRFEDGRVAERWADPSALGQVLAQLGLGG